MLKNKQLIVSNVNGDCLRACITSILGIPNSNDLPDTAGDNGAGYIKWLNMLREVGIDLDYRHKDCWQSGYWIASVKSKNYEGGTHAIVMNGSKVWHDQSPKKRYHAGYYLLGKDVVVGGYLINIMDIDKLAASIVGGKVRL